MHDSVLKVCSKVGVDTMIDGGAVDVDMDESDIRGICTSESASEGSKTQPRLSLVNLN